MLWWLAFLVCAESSWPVACAQSPAKTIPVIFDTDIGTDIDDAFALGLILASPELDLRGITTVGASAEDRAWIVCRFLTHVGRSEVPVAWGRNPHVGEPIDWQIQYRRHPAAVWNRTAKPLQQPAVEFLYDQLKANPGKLTIIAAGPLSNLGQLLETHPDSKPWIQRIVFSADKNLKTDVRAAQLIFSSGIPLSMADVAPNSGFELGPSLRDRLFGAQTPLTFQIQGLYELWDRPTPVLFACADVAITLTDQFSTPVELRLEIGADGTLMRNAAQPNARVATAMRGRELIEWTIKRLSSLGDEVLPKPPANESQLIPRAGMPNRVHVVEDYETDIEKRWWMTGKLETRDVPPGSTRAFRAVLTQDYDDRMGDLKASYRAVIFNPVPGPPMGRHTRLGFRYKLHGTDTMRVQLFSLSNGYHRYLCLKGLPQDAWTEGTVDMTQMRRPDGSGGPLNENERIDDIQFYIDPRAQVLIDDIVLYDAAAPEEKRPFPKRIVFTAWFDTGKQGQEWPGDFEIVAHEPPLPWKAAKSVTNKESGSPWIRLSLRGLRQLPERTHVRFKHQLTSGGAIGVSLVNSKTGFVLTQKCEALRTDRWTAATVAFEVRRDLSQKNQNFGNAPLQIDEIHFKPPEGGTLMIDDVLVYEPSEG